MRLWTITVSTGVLALAVVAHAKTPGQIYNEKGPAVVLLLGTDDGRSASFGAGSIITPDGKIITSAHVVTNRGGRPYKHLFVFLKPRKVTGDAKKDLRRRYLGKVVAWNPSNNLDLALVRLVKPPPSLPTIAFSEPDAVSAGDQALTCGHPESAGMWTLTQGMVRTVMSNHGGIKGKDVLQTDASLNRGNSGGPVWNEDGNMIGVITAPAQSRVGSYAIKSDVVVNWLARKGLKLAYAGKTGKPPARPVLADTTPGGKRPPKPPTPQEKSPTKAVEKVVARAPALTVKNSRPRIITARRPYKEGDFWRDAFEELEKMMDAMAGRNRNKKSRKKRNGMGLW